MFRKFNKIHGLCGENVSEAERNVKQGEQWGLEFGAENHGLVNTFMVRLAQKPRFSRRF
jgi:hypothetical protein